MLVTGQEAGRGLFNGYVKFFPREFKKTVRAVHDEWQNSREKISDQALYQKLLNLFMDTFCTTADARVQINAFFKQQVEAKIHAKVDEMYQVKSHSSALTALLWDSKRGEIEETAQERQRQKALIEAGETSFKAFKASLAGEQKANCKKAADAALENLEKSRNDIYDKLNAKTHQWDFATHTLKELPTRGDRRTESETSSASRDIKLNEISIFVTQFFAERDRSAVEAYLIHEALKEVKEQSKEIYIHYTEGWAG
ncbi:MAG: hypothetical protein LLG04_06055, partial [Parachlamydia sp.]|nr:hypothetical protein [Parachlamydia sp.]